MIYIDEIKDDNGDILHPKTELEAVFDKDGNRADHVIEDIKENLYKLDYANKVDLKTALNSQEKTYTIPKNGILRILATNTANGDAYFILSSNLKGNMFMHSRDYYQYSGSTVQAQVEKNEVITVYRLTSNKAVQYCEFIPYKLG